jgi:hypothetical protein
MLQPTPDTTITWLTATEHIKAARLLTGISLAGLDPSRAVLYLQSLAVPVPKTSKNLLNRLQQPITGAS